MKLSAVLLLLALAHLTISGTLVNTPPSFSRPAYGPPSAGPASGYALQARAPVSRSATATVIDAQIRGTYWYYLPGAFLTYVAHIDSEEGCLYLHLYKNYVGTFLAISNYLDIAGTVTINTFVRVGDGCTDYGQISQPVNVQTLVISLNLGAGEYFVPHDESPHDGNRFTENWARSKWFKNKRDQDNVHQNCQKVESYIKKQYWYYLTPDTKTLDYSESNPGSGCYCSFTYINYVGLFQVIGQWDYSKNQPVVNTFVRLGDGSDPNQITKCSIFPSVS
jgi:hypothetical protein